MAPPTVGRSSHFNKHNQNNFQRHVNQIQIISYCDSLDGVKLTEQILTDCPTYLFMERLTEPRTQQFSYTCWYRSQGFSCLASPGWDTDIRLLQMVFLIWLRGGWWTQVLRLIKLVTYWDTSPAFSLLLFLAKLWQFPPGFSETIISERVRKEGKNKGMREKRKELKNKNIFPATQIRL